jgi:hypothetical protein
MRTASEKLAEIKIREAEIRSRKMRRQTVALSFLSAAAAVLLVFAGLKMIPAIVGSDGDYDMSARYASIFSNDPAIGFILVIALAFALGVCVTLLCIKVHRHTEREKRK